MAKIRSIQLSSTIDQLWTSQLISSMEVDNSRSCLLAIVKYMILSNWSYRIEFPGALALVWTRNVVMIYLLSNIYYNYVCCATSYLLQLYVVLLHYNYVCCATSFPAFCY
jgi:hypothetical protein